MGKVKASRKAWRKKAFEKMRSWDLVDVGLNVFLCILIGLVIFLLVLFVCNMITLCMSGTNICRLWV